jgi:succinoglycan biosynthesis transport protein ExoP
MSPLDFLPIVWRRKWWLIVCLCLGSVIAVAYAYSLPPMYRSSTLILVEAPKVPASYVSSTVTTPIQERLNTLNQQIMSRTNLERIARDFGLEQKHAEPTYLDRFIERAKKKLRSTLASYGYDIFPERPAPQAQGISDQTIERLRRNIEVSVVGRGRNDAFTVSYSGPEPQTVMRVTGTLASLYIEKNLRARERRVEGTSEFIEQQLELARSELEHQEGRIKEFKEAHMGALPEQLDANLRKVDHQQAALQSHNEALASAEERKAMYQRQLVDVESQTVPVSPTGAPVDPRRAELARLHDRLAGLQAQFNENYPDIGILKRQIRELEARLTGSPAQPSDEDTEAGAPAASASPLRTQIAAELQAVNSEIRSLRSQRQQIEAALQAYEKRIDATFDNEQQLHDLSRDYNVTRQNYQSLLEKRLSAKLSESLEKRQKGEQFRIIDPAYLPNQPYKPDRPRVILMGMALSTGLGIGLIFLLEVLNPTGYRKAEDVRSAFEIPVLATIPHNAISRKDHRLIAVEEEDSIITEQYRVLFTRLDSLNRERSQKVFAISSAIPHEGKTITALNLAVVMARDFGRQTLLMEGDFKRPELASYLRTELQGGLVDVLLDNSPNNTIQGPLADILLPFVDDRLTVLPSARKVWNSSGLLSSQRMKDLLAVLRDRYDFIIIDAPPVLPLSDMNVFQEVVDGIVLMIRAESTPRNVVVSALEALDPAKLTGLVLNDTRQALHRYYKKDYYHAKIKT